MTLTYQYKTSDSEAEYYCKLRKLEKPENHHLYINYHGDGKVSDLQIPYPQGPKRKKRITLARFEYKDTYTDVYDAHGIRTAYARSPEKRIVAIDKFTRHNQYYSTMRYYWCKEGVNLGNLLAKGLFIPVPRNPCLYITVGAYDDRNNLISEDFYGNLSGNNDASFELRADHRPDRPVECFSRIMSYSNDRFNLPVREECSDGKVIAMAYLPETNLLTSKLLGDHQKWYQREFRSYDSNHLLIEMITDDGSGTHQEDLTDVTCRKITTIVPRLTAPAVGFPQTTIESYLDLTTGEQKQLRRIENIYNASELLIRQDLYDANDQFCYTLAFDYDNKRNLIRQTDALGQTTTMAYDENKNKIREKLEGSGFHTLFSYDLMDRLIKRVEKHDDGPCFITEYCYDLVGNRIAQVESYNSIGSEHADGTGTTTHFKYDEFGREIEVQYPPCATLGQGYQPSWVRKEYNVLDQLTAVIDQKGHKTTTSYNVRGQPICITYPDGTQERCQYHLNGVLAKKWEKEGLCHHYTYDGFSRLIRTDTYDSLGILQYSLEKEYTGAHLTRETDALGYSTTFEYDFAGRKINERKEGTGAFSLSTFAYDSLGRLRTTRQYFGSAEPDYIAQIQEYDFLDRVIETRIEDATGTILRRETYAYDRLGNRTQTHVYSSENVCSTTQTLYDSHGMPIQQIDALGNITQIAYNYEYRNAHNQKVLQKTTTDPLGNQTVETFDALYRLVCVEKRNTKGLTTALQEVCYSPAGEKVRQREKVITFGQPSHDYIISWCYDSMQRPLKMTEQGGALSKVTNYTYDSVGRLQTLTKPDGITLHHQYDSLGRLARLTSSDGTIDYHYTYDLHNNPITTTDLCSQRSTRREYDAWNHLVFEKLANETCFRYRYDNLERLTQVTLPDLGSIEYSYHGLELSKVSRFDPQGRLLYEHAYLDYDLVGRELASQLIGKAGHQTRQWDALGHNTKIETPFWSQDIPENGFDHVGNLSHVYKKDPLGSAEEHYHYDDLYQLVAEEGPLAHTYAYDSLQNRRQKDAEPYSVNELNQTLSCSEARYEYDLDGNRIGKTEADTTTHYIYDALNRLTSVEQRQKWRVTYSYDTFGRRLARTLSTWNINGWSDPQTTSYLYQGQKEIGAMENGHIIQLRVLGNGKGAELGAAIALELNQKVYAPIHDHRGNVCCLVDSETGIAVESYRYSAFGELKIYDSANVAQAYSTIANPWLFASKRLDAHTDLFQFGRRDYDRNLGRWLTPDPMGFVDGPNLYAYVHNSPLTLFDPWGLEASLYDRSRAGVSAGSRLCGGSRVVKASSGNNQERDRSASGSAWVGPSSFFERCKKGYYATKYSWNLLSNEQQEIAIYGTLSIAAQIPFLREVVIVGRYLYTAHNLTRGLRGDVSQVSNRILKESKGSSSRGDKKFSEIDIPAELPGVSASSPVATQQPGVSVVEGDFYVPICPNTGRPLPLPRNPHGQNIPSAETPHTQLGMREGSKGSYRQTREWGYDGQQVKTTDWTDHGRPGVHSNPHDHPTIPNPTGGTPKRGKGKLNPDE